MSQVRFDFMGAEVEAHLDVLDRDPLNVQLSMTFSQNPDTALTHTIKINCVDAKDLKRMGKLFDDLQTELKVIKKLN